MKNVVNVIAATFVALFAVVWLAIVVQLLRYVPSDQHPVLELPDAWLTTAGFLATTVGAGTAAVLGITISVVGLQGDPAKSLGQSISDEVGVNKLLFGGILVYFFVGVVVLLMWLFKADTSPDIFKTFALGVLGWAGGAFGSVFKSKTT